MAFDPTALLSVLSGVGGYGQGVGQQQAAQAQRDFQQKELDEQTAARQQVAQQAAQARRDVASTQASQRTQSALQTAADKFYSDSKDKGILWAPGSVEKALSAANMPSDPSNPASAATAAMPQVMMSRAATALQAAAKSGQDTAMEGGLGLVKAPKAAPTENETWTVSPEFQTKDGKPIKISNRGSFQDMNGAPLNPSQVSRFEKPTGEHWTPAGMDSATGQPLLLNTQTGETKIGGGVKAAVGGSGGAQGNRQKDYVALMEQAMPDMKTYSPLVNPSLITAAIKYPMAANYALGPEEKAYLASARNFLAGVLHEESGARLSDAQLAFGVQRYFPIGGDEPEDVARKQANAEETLRMRKQNANYVPPGAPVSDAAKASFNAVAEGGGRAGGSGMGKTITKDEAAYFTPQELRTLQQRGFTIQPNE